MKKSVRVRRWRIGSTAILIVSLFIWIHSLIPADQSSAESGWIVTVLAPVFEMLQVEPDLWQTLVRKGAHMTEFALLAAVWIITLARNKIGSWWPKAGVTAAACMATALIDETIQLRVPGRSGQISDVWIDLLGAAVGIAICALTIGITRLRKARKVSVDFQ